MSTTNTSEAVLAEKTLFRTTSFGKVYAIDFDFSNADQKTILSFLQVNNYSLLGYKGATGTNQVPTGWPTWFVKPFMEMHDKVVIDCEPVYKVYVYNTPTIGTNTRIQMECLSVEIPLGKAVQFNSDGTFSVIGSANPEMITVLNNCPAGTSNITIGLASKVNGEFAPFCAFTCKPQETINIKPNEKMCLFAAPTNMLSGSIVGHTTAPGCTFEFNDSRIGFDLQIINNTYGITSIKGGNPVIQISSGTLLNQLLNTTHS